jgi:hypothetical protein
MTREKVKQIAEYLFCQLSVDSLVTRSAERKVRSVIEKSIRVLLRSGDIIIIMRKKP